MNDLKSGSKKTATTLKLITKAGFITAACPFKKLSKVQFQNKKDHIESRLAMGLKFDLNYYLFQTFAHPHLASVL